MEDRFFPKEDLKTIRFLQKQSPYNIGEIAGFAPDVADACVKAGVAEWYEPPRDAPGKPPPLHAGAVGEGVADQTVSEVQTSPEGPVDAGGVPIDVTRKDETVKQDEPATEQASEAQEAAQAPKHTSRRGR
jgi:hypothetical protein